MTRKLISEELRRQATNAGDEAALASMNRQEKRGEPRDWDEVVHEAMFAVIDTIERELGAKLP